MKAAFLAIVAIIMAESVVVVISTVAANWNIVRLGVWLSQ